MFKVAIITILFAMYRVNAMPVFAVVDSKCSATTGAIVAVDDSSLTILSVDGDFRTIARKDVSAVAEYYLVEPPFTSVKQPNVLPPLYRVGTDYFEEPFSGFAVGFVDDSALFFDDQGRIRVVELQRITTLRPTLDWTKFTLEAYEKTSFEGLSTSLCPVAPMTSDHKIEKIYNTEIQLQLLFNRMFEGYAELESLAERTLFYDKPLVFDQKTRIGAKHTSKPFLSELKFPQPFYEAGLPVYLNFSRGAPYRFQTRFEFGPQSYGNLPFQRPIGGLASYFKSHLIHGEVIFNLDGLSAGKPVFARDERQMMTFLEDSKVVHFFSAQSFNYLTLLGLDYQNLSFSFGNFYPVFVIRGPGEMRIVKPPRSSLVARFGVTTAVGRFETLGFYTDTRAEGYTDPRAVADQLKASDAILVVSETYRPETYHLKAYNLRLNWKWDATEIINCRGSVLHGQTYYSETSLVEMTGSGGSRSFDGRQLRIRQNDLSVLAGVHLDLSKYVALGAEGIFYQGDSHTNKEWREGGERLEHTYYQAVFEILL